uniref:Uncharacterized protein n=1 Tax=Opuntia streptacantha TaxID=393608 RepID=A0A7C8Z0I8_OPUST
MMTCLYMSCCSRLLSLAELTNQEGIHGSCSIFVWLVSTALTRIIERFVYLEKCAPLKHILIMVIGVESGGLICDLSHRTKSSLFFFLQDQTKPDACYDDPS